MRLEPGPLDNAPPCLFCGGMFYAVRVGRALFPMCEDCGRSPAEAYLDAKTQAPASPPQS